MLPHLETPEWKAVEKQLRPASLADSGRFMAWVQDGMPEAGARLPSLDDSGAGDFSAQQACRQVVLPGRRARLAAAR